MRFSRDQRRHQPLIDLTPMIDVVFLLIIFFLTTAQFARVTRAEVDLPLEEGEQLASADEPGVIVNIRKDGAIVVDERDLTLEELRAIIRREIDLQTDGGAENVKLLIRADRDLPAKRLNEVVTAMRDLGVGLGRFGTEIPR